MYVDAYDTSSLYKWKFLQHALSGYVYSRKLYVIFTKVKTTEE